MLIISKEKEINLKAFDFEQELKYLTDLFINSSKNSDNNKKEESLDIITTKPKKIKTFLSKKRKIFKTPTSNKNKNSDEGECKSKIKPRKKNKFPKILDRKKLLNILKYKPMKPSKKKYYLDLLLETTHLV